VVRHHIVQRIVEAYEQWDEQQDEASGARERPAMPTDDGG
jgi:phosphate starvation-inducible protein PhoH